MLSYILVIKLLIPDGKVAELDMPIALNTLAMLEEHGDMHANLFEYVHGEEEENRNTTAISMSLIALTLWFL